MVATCGWFPGRERFPGAIRYIFMATNPKTWINGDDNQAKRQEFTHENDRTTQERRIQYLYLAHKGKGSDYP